MTPFTELVGCRRPVQGAGMGWIAGEELCAAVTDAGGLGMVAMPGVPAFVLAPVLERLRAACGGPFGVNFLVPFLDPSVLEVAGALAPVVELFYGWPDRALVERAAPALVLWQVGSADEARAAVDAGAAAVVAQGTEAGGHVRGEQALLPLLDAVRAAVTVPVVASGGLSSRAAVAVALDAGADGVRIGTALLAAREADVHPDYVAALLAADGDDTVLTTEFAVGWPDAPHRVLRAALEKARRIRAETTGTIDLAGRRVPVVLRSPLAATRSFEGDASPTAMYAGTGVGAVHTVRSAAEILDDLLPEETEP
jgi:nitronate monooxygenase